MTKTKKFFNDIVFYAGSNFVSNILNFIIGIAVRRILQPAMMGLFNGILLIFDYSRYSHIGIIDALDKELPCSFGKKDKAKFDELKDIGFSICIMVTIFLCAGIFISSFFINTGSSLLRGGIRIVSLMVVLRLLNSFYIVLNRSQNKFSIISKYTVLLAVLDTVFKIALVIKFGLYGLLWASVITTALGLFYLYKVSAEAFRFVTSFSYREAAGLLKVGFPIFVMGFVFMTLTSLDRIMIIRFLDMEKLGFYTIALMMSAYILQLPNLVCAVIFPRFYQAYGEKQNIHEIKDFFIKPTLIFAYLFPILVGLAIIALPLVIRYILPSYIPGLLPAYILLFGASFISLVNMPGYLLIALNKQVYIVFIGIGSIFVGVLLSYIFVRRLNLGLSGIAIAASLSQLLYTTVLMLVAFRNYTKSALAHAKFFAQLYLPFIWVFTILFFIQAFTFDMSGNLYKDSMFALCRWVVLLLGCLPLMWYVNKKTAILALLKEAYKKKGLKAVC